MMVREENPLPLRARAGARVVARVVAIGGFDPTGGAGVVRDFITCAALGADVRLVPTALTEQSSAGVTAIEPRGPVELQGAIATALAIFCGGGGPAGASVKVGMLPDRRSVDAVTQALDDFAGAVVVDPVLASSSGGALFVGPVSELGPLLARATLVTPNALELAALTGAPVTDLASAVSAGQELVRTGVRAVLVKGGHLGGEGDDEVIDTLIVAGSPGAPLMVEHWRRKRLAGGDVRGTGCALASAIAVGLAEGRGLVEAVARARDWLATAMASAVRVGPDRHLGPG